MRGPTSLLRRGNYAWTPGAVRVFAFSVHSVLLTALYAVCSLRVGVPGEIFSGTYDIRIGNCGDDYR